MMDRSSFIPRDSRLLMLSDWIAAALGLWFYAGWCAKMLAMSVASLLSPQFCMGALMGLCATGVLLMVVKAVLYFFSSFVHSLSQPSVALPTLDAVIENAIQGWRSVFFSARSLQIIPSRA